MVSASTVVQRLLRGSEVRSIERLRSSERTVVERVRLTRLSTGEPENVVVKRLLQKAGFAAEAGALSVMPAGAPAPQLLAEDPVEGVIIMTDVGSGPSLADALLGDSADAAQAALRSWAEAIARIHRRTAGLGRSFRAAVVERGGSEVEVDPMSRWLAATPTLIDGAGVELVVPAHIEAELSSIMATLDDPAGKALSQGDACPDNNILVPTGLRLVDFEEAVFRHVAWDLAYLRVPWPSCWCAWNLPVASAEAATAHYLRAVGDGLAGAGPSTLREAVEVATLAFALIAAAWFLPSALQRDDTLGAPGHHAPSRRAAVLHRLTLAADIAAELDYQTTSAAARSWTHTLQRRWGPRSLPSCPAFR